MQARESITNSDRLSSLSFLWAARSRDWQNELPQIEQIEMSV